ncbi:MAG: biopolymer transporter ExbD [Synergistaceae bacterium]|jgi:biopolymer transport protein ExbD|nr:biopolymer transporter ExbD [Synergistaceae bacterium]
MRRAGAEKQPDIDVTPLIDILFMLIIFFVLAASFLDGRITVALPSAEGEMADQAEKSVIINVERDGSVLWGATRMPAPVSEADLSQAARGVGDEKVLVAGDSGAPYGVVVTVLDALRSAGLVSAGLLVRP